MVFDDVETTREAAKDSDMVARHVGHMHVKCQKSLNQSQQHQRPQWGQFVQGLCKKYPAQGAGTINWTQLGEQALELLQCTPTAQFMFGPLGAAPAAAKKRQLGERAPRQDKPQQHSHCDNLADRPEEDAERPSNHHMDTIKTVNSRLEEHTAEKPIELYRFVFQPESFPQTVENLFALSFLIKENKAKHTVSSSGVQLIQQLPKDAHQSKHPERRQCILKFDHHHFRSLKERFKSTPCIPYRTQ